MLNKIAEKLLLETGLVQNDIKELKTLENEVNVSLKEAMDISIENVENSDMSITEKNDKKEIINKNIKKALVLEFIVNCEEMANERNVGLEEYIEVLSNDINKTLLRARIIKGISITFLALAFILNKLIIVQSNYTFIKLMIFSLVTFCSLLFVYMPSNMLTKKFKALRNLISEAKKNLYFDEQK